MKRFFLALFIPIFIVTLLNLPVIWTLAKLSFAPPARADAVTSVPADTLADNTLVIPALGLEAPIVTSTADPTIVSDWATLKKDLTQGVGLVDGLAKPGEPGYTALLGHSSDATPHRYAAVFAGLSALRPGDVIQVKYRGTAASYVVAEKKYLAPTDPFLLTELKKKEGDSQLALVTCWPLFTTAKRLVVLATPQPISEN